MTNGDPVDQNMLGLVTEGLCVVIMDQNMLGLVIKWLKWTIFWKK